MHSLIDKFYFRLRATAIRSIDFLVICTPAAWYYSALFWYNSFTQKTVFILTIFSALKIGAKVAQTKVRETKAETATTAKHKIRIKIKAEINSIKTVKYLHVINYFLH